MGHARGRAPDGGVPRRPLAADEVEAIPDLVLARLVLSTLLVEYQLANVPHLAPHVAVERPLTLAALAGEPVTAEQVAAVQPFLDEAVPPRVTVVDGIPAPGPPETVDDALARLALSALTQLGGPERTHLGACGDEDCHMAFLDQSGRRRWCSSQRCGVRARVRAHRARAGTDESQA